MTICTHCKYHNGASSAEPRSQHFCQHPGEKRKRKRDPVTGRYRYEYIRDYFTASQLVNEQYPHCHTINYGNCHLFKKK